VVLDSSAVLAMFLDEPGADLVQAHLSGASMSAVNFQETAKVLLAMGFSPPMIRWMLESLSLHVHPHDVEDAFQAAELSPLTKSHGRGLGDRTCMALAIKLGVPALTADRAWAQLAIPGLQVILAR
jgi:ribonuclease VapC